MKKIIFGLLCCAFLISCNDNLKVSINNELPNNTILKFSEKDSSFLKNYKNIRYLIDSSFSGSIAKTEFSSLTYREVFDYLNDFKNEEQLILNNSKNLSEWREKYKSSLNKFDKDSINFSTYIKNNNWEDFITINLLSIVSEKDWMGLDRFYANLSITGKNSNVVRKVSGYLYFENVGDKPKTENEYMQESSIFSYTGNPKGSLLVKGFDIDNYRNDETNLRELVNIPVEIIKQKYNIRFSLQYLIINNKYIDVKFEKIPYYASKYLTTKDEYYKTQYILSFDPNYEEYIIYVKQIVNEKLESKHHLAKQFYYQGYKSILL